MDGQAAEFLVGRRSLYRAEELLLHRKHRGQHEETLVKWARLPCSGRQQTEQEKDDDTSREYLIWMRTEEIKACCPQLSGGASTRATRKPEGTLSLREAGEERDNLSSGETEQAETDDSLQEMAEDVRMLVERARRITQRVSAKTPTPGSEKHLTNTVNILSAYAKLGSLADSFRQCGALDLLLNLLSTQLPEVRHSAGEMLRSLSAYDSASRAYVLLQLTQREEEEGRVTSLENRHMLLDLFAETASQGEDSLGCSDLALPKVWYSNDCLCTAILECPVPAHTHSGVW